MNPKHSSKYSDQTPPDGVGDYTTPQPFMGHDYSFTLQAVMELQKATGQLTANISSLQAAIDKQTEKFEKMEDKLLGKLDKLENTVSGVTHKLYAAGVVLLIAITVGGFIVNKAWDLMAKQITIAPLQSPATPPKVP